MVQALHVHDNFGATDNHLLPGHGKLKWNEITKALAEIGYDGCFTLEVSNYWNAFTAEEMPDAMAMAAKVARRLADQVEAFRNA
jgi:sugar phosphate isomerase/epimerase